MISPPGQDARTPSVPCGAALQHRSVARTASSQLAPVRTRAIAVAALLLAALASAVLPVEAPPSSTWPGILSEDGPGFGIGTLARIGALWGDPNTRVVLLGTALLGISAGIVGVFLVLRRQALVGDVVGHATLPGIAIAFLVLEGLSPGSGKSTAGLLAGAFCAGLAGAGAMLLAERRTTLKPDAIQAVVLSVFYGFGAALLSVIQQVPGGNSAGLKDYLNGKTATLLASDVTLFAGVAVGLVVLTLLLFKELTLVAFDDDFAAAGGWPVGWLNTLLMLLVVGITVLGLQSVGLILVVAALIIPAAAARFWTNEVHRMAAISAAIGGVSSVLGVLASTTIPRVAAGGAIVLAGSALFFLSFCFGSERGLLPRWVRHRNLVKKTERQHLLRGLYEILEQRSPAERGPAAGLSPSPAVSREEVAKLRDWRPHQLDRLLAWGGRAGFLAITPRGVELTASGMEESARLVRNHRLWELYLLQYADMALERVDRDADEIEHVLDTDLIKELEARLPVPVPGTPLSTDRTNLPPSPH